MARTSTASEQHKFFHVMTPAMPFFSILYFPVTSFGRTDAAKQALVLQFPDIFFDGTLAHTNEMRQAWYG
jgi:hypothetical protein